MAKDPICGMDVDEKTGLRLEHDGQTYYFCSPGCRDRFLSEKGLLEPPADETQQSDDREALEPHIEKTTLSIKGMHCASCASPKRVCLSPPLTRHNNLTIEKR